MDLLKLALRYIDEKDFWDMTIAEVQRKIEAIQEGRKERLKDQAVMDYTLATLITNFSFGEQKLSLYDAYPQLFQEEYDEQQREQDRINQSTANFLNFAIQYNRKYGEG